MRIRHVAPPPTAPGPATGSRLRFWGAFYALLFLIAGTNLPTPLYHGLQQRFGFSSLTVTLLFAVYVAVLVPSLLFFGPLSDAVGRRRVLVPAVAVAALGSMVFALATDLTWLFGARLLQGVAVGAASGPLTAALNEAEPSGDRRRAALAATLASAGGLGAGPLLAGVLAQYGPAPYRLPFVVEIVLLVPALVAVALLPVGRPGAAWRPRRPSIPPAMRGTFGTSAAVSFLGFTVVGLFLTLVPAYVTGLSGSDNLALSGGAVALMLCCACGAQLLAYGKSTRVLQITGLALLATGSVLLAAAGAVSSLPLLGAATVLGGIGQGRLYLGSITEVNRAAPPHRSADVLSSFYVVGYFGVAVPVIGCGLLAQRTGLLHAVQLFTAVVAVLCLAALTVLRRRAHHA
ncbi:valanimycin resistance [Streptomyces albireticuli]|uniref:Valanimycin resistance n=1 Tax=Streptomyces albireticuli TaxID=1940 RepID=A0A1Z2LD04_9ACTN|nr:MFS transporter [Streptomyces albireticuli]ARZ72200.1 valanimycin resistance [Streptomyces albireticuli]